MYTARAIYEVIGKVPRYMRPPFGDIDDRVVAITNLLGTITANSANDKDSFRLFGIKTLKIGDYLHLIQVARQISL